MKPPIIDEAQLVQNIKNNQNPFFEEYFAFYSSWFGGILKNPRLMLLPIDDHMVHRGDGIFEAMKAVGGSVYLLEEHLERLIKSAELISLKLPFRLDVIREIILETTRVANTSEAVIRVYLSRGPGNFSVNPYDSVNPQLYVLVTKLIEPAAEKYKNGVVIGKSIIPIKSGWMPQVKSCNYLPNVLMKKEAVDRGLDFVVGLDLENNITEGPTENIMIVDKRGTLVHPPLEFILKGTTMIRACELAQKMDMATDIRPISIEDLQSASEVMITGTSLNVLPVVQFEDHLISDGKPGPVAVKLNSLMLNDIKSGIHSVSF